MKNSILFFKNLSAKKTREDAVESKEKRKFAY